MGQQQPSSRLRNSLEFNQGFFGVEPMDGLPGRYDIDRFIREGDFFSRSGQAVEAGPIAETGLCDHSHGIVGFHGINRLEVIEQVAGEHTSTRANVGDDTIVRQTKFSTKLSIASGLKSGR